MAPHHLVQPQTRFLDWSVKSAAQLSLYCLQLCPHPFGNRFTPNFKPAVRPCSAAVVGKSEEIKRLGFPFSGLCTVFLRRFSEFKQPCFVGVER